jgi:excisionase family DNA binding protein
VTARGALSPAEAAAWLGIARSTFYADVLAELRVVQLGRRKLIPVSELERWLDEHAARPIAGRT